MWIFQAEDALCLRQSCGWWKRCRVLHVWKSKEMQQYPWVIGEFSKMFYSAKTLESGNPAAFSALAQQILYFGFSFKSRSLVLFSARRNISSHNIFRGIFLTSDTGNNKVLSWHSLFCAVRTVAETITKHSRTFALFEDHFPANWKQKAWCLAFTFNLTRQGSLMCFFFLEITKHPLLVFKHMQICCCSFMMHQMNQMGVMDDCMIYTIDVDGCRSLVQGVPWAKQRLWQVMLGSLVLRCGFLAFFNLHLKDVQGEWWSNWIG